MASAAELETKMREIDEQIRKCQKELNELEPSDMDKNSPKQGELSRLIQKRQQIQERWEKVLTEHGR